MEDHDLVRGFTADVQREIEHLARVGVIPMKPIGDDDIIVAVQDGHIVANVLVDWDIDDEDDRDVPNELRDGAVIAALSELYDAVQAL